MFSLLVNGSHKTLNTLFHISALNGIQMKQTSFIYSAQTLRTPAAQFSSGCDSLYKEINGIARVLERVLHAGTTLGEKTAVSRLLVHKQQTRKDEQLNKLGF